MRTRSDYSELLRDPRWQRMRLEVMSRDRFACLECFNTTKTLNVHHTYYERGAAPWEYPASSLRTLCEDCHTEISRLTDLAKRQFGRLGIRSLSQAIGYAAGLESALAMVMGVTETDLPPGQPDQFKPGQPATEGFMVAYEIPYGDQVQLSRKGRLSIDGIRDLHCTHNAAQLDNYEPVENFYTDTLA